MYSQYRIIVSTQGNYHLCVKQTGQAPPTRPCEPAASRPDSTHTAAKSEGSRVANRSPDEVEAGCDAPPKGTTSELFELRI